MITARDISVAELLFKYYVLSRAQVQRLAFRDDKSGRITRRSLQKLVDIGFIHRHSLFTYNHLLSAPAPVYYPTQNGAEFLAAHFGDERYLAANTNPPNGANLHHWLAISDMHITIDEAVEGKSDIAIDGWINEYDVVNKDESKPENRYRLYTLLREAPRLSCAPDAAFLLNVGGHKKVFYLEVDLGTSGVHRIAGARPKGYAVLQEMQLHRRHFPETTLDTFTVLMIAPTAQRRDALKKAFREAPGTDLWRFAARDDVTPKAFLHNAIFHAVNSDPKSLLRPEAKANGTDATAIALPIKVEVNANVKPNVSEAVTLDGQRT